MMSMSFHLGYITGPSIGGFLVDTVGWRWIFFMNMPVADRGGIDGLESSARESVTEKRDYSLDPIGMITLLMTAVSLIVGLQQDRQVRLRPVFAGCFRAPANFLFYCCTSSAKIRRLCSICRCSRCGFSPPLF